MKFLYYKKNKAWCLTDIEYLAFKDSTIMVISQ